MKKEECNRICLIEVAYIVANWKRVCFTDMNGGVLRQQNEELSVFQRMTLMYGKDVALRSRLHEVNTVC